LTSGYAVALSGSVMMLVLHM